MSRYTTPGSDFGNLAIGSSGKAMPVTTRAASRRGRNLTASQAASSSRVTAGSSRTQPAQPPPILPAESEDDDDSDGSDDDDSSDDGEAVATASGPGGNVVEAEIVRIMAIFDPFGLSPNEFAQADANSDRASQVTRELATYISGLIRSPNDLHQLRQIVPVGTGFWAAQLASNMQRRYSIIVQRLRENVQNAAHGDGVVRTIENLRALFAAIDSIRRDHFQTMSLAERRPFFTLLMDILEYSLLNDHDQYGNSARPAYAGEGVQSERRLFMAFLAPRAQPLAFLAVIWHCGSALVREFRGRIDRMRVTLEGFWQRMGEDHPNRAQLARVKQYLGSLAQLARTPP